MKNNNSIDIKNADLDSFDGLRGNELLEKNEELKEEDYSLQDRVYECGYTLNGNASYEHYFKALEEAKGTKIEDIFFEHFSESDVPYIAFEVAKQLKVMYFYSDLIDELNNKNIEFFKAFKIIKNIELRANYKDLYKTGFIKDNKNIDQDREIIKGQDLITKITNSDGSMNYDSWLITECGYELFDKDDNESADALSFFEEVVKTKNFKP